MMTGMFIISLLFLVMMAMLVVVTLVQTGRADTVELRNGTTVEGKYAGGTSSTVLLETPQGVQTLQAADVAAVKFTGATAATAVPAAAPQADPPGR